MRLIPHVIRLCELVGKLYANRFGTQGPTFRAGQRTIAYPILPANGLHVRSVAYAFDLFALGIA